jgi:hypothetical protein
VDDKQLTVGQLKMKSGCFLALVPPNEETAFETKVKSRKPSFEPICKLEIGDVVDVLQLNTVNIN